MEIEYYAGLKTWQIIKFLNYKVLSVHIVKQFNSLELHVYIISSYFKHKLELKNT